MNTFFDPLGAANNNAVNVGALQTRIVSAELSPMNNYHAMHSYTHSLNVQNTHIANLDALSGGGQNFGPGVVSRALGPALNMTETRGAIPLNDTGDLSFASVKRQYQNDRFAFMINMEYRTGTDIYGAMTLFGYTDRAEVMNGVIPKNLILTVNACTIYRFESMGNGRRKPRIVFAGRVHPKNPLAPVLHRPNGNLGSFSGFAGTEEQGQALQFGSVSSASIGAQLAQEQNIRAGDDVNRADGKWTDTGFSAFDGSVTMSDSRLTASGITGDAFNNASSVRMVDALCSGFSEASRELAETYKQNIGRFVDNEARDLFGLPSNGNGLMYKWQLAAEKESSDLDFQSSRVVEYLGRFSQHFMRTARISYGEITRAFKDLDDKMVVHTNTLHKDMELIYKLENNPSDHNGGFIEASLARQVNQMVPSIVASYGFQRFSFMATNRTKLSAFGGGMKDSATPLPNASHPFLNRDAGTMREIMQKVCDTIIREIAPMLGDHGHRSYMLEVHYAFRGDCRISIGCDGPRRDYTLATFCDAQSSASSSFRPLHDRSDYAGKISGIMDQLGTNPNIPTNRPSDWGKPANNAGGWGERNVDTNAWGDSFAPTVGIHQYKG